MKEYEHPQRTKTVCQICVDKYADENLMLGRCCGLPLIEVPWTKDDYIEHQQKKEAITKIMLREILW